MTWWVWDEYQRAVLCDHHATKLDATTSERNALRMKASALLRGRRLVEGPHQGRYRAWAVGLDAAWGDTPEDALRTLIAQIAPALADLRK